MWTIPCWSEKPIYDTNPSIGACRKFKDDEYTKIILLLGCFCFKKIKETQSVMLVALFEGWFFLKNMTMVKKYKKSKIVIFVVFSMTFTARKTDNLAAEILVKPISTKYSSYYYDSPSCKSKVLLSFVFKQILCEQVSKEH